MKSVILRSNALAGLLCVACFLPSGSAFGQAAPGPLHPSEPLPAASAPPAPKKQPRVEPRKTIAGFWKLNSDESDDPQRKVEDTQGPGGGPGGGMGGPGRRPGIGYPFPGPIGGNGPYGGPRGGMGRGGEEDDSRDKMKGMIRPAESLTVEMKEAEMTLTNEHGDKLVIYADGRKIEKSKNDSVQEVSGHWNGSQLITDEKSPQGRKMSRTLELSADGRQFTETWRIETRRSDSPIVVRYVYDAARQD